MNIAEVIEFLDARIAEDESAVPLRPAPTLSDDFLAEADDAQHGYLPLEPGVMTVSTARVLAECEAKRRIVDLHRGIPESKVWPERLVCPTCLAARWGYSDDWSPDPWPCDTIKAVVAVYAYHPDFREVWRT